MGRSPASEPGCDFFSHPPARCSDRRLHWSCSQLHRRCRPTDSARRLQRSSMKMIYWDRLRPISGSVPVSMCCGGAVMSVSVSMTGRVELILSEDQRDVISTGCSPASEPGCDFFSGLLGALAVRCGSRCCSPIRVCSLRRGCRSVAARVDAVFSKSNSVSFPL